MYFRLPVVAKHIIIYGISLALLLVLLKWLELRLLLQAASTDAFVGAVALLFTGLGIWLAGKLFRPQTTVIDHNTIVPTLDTPAVASFRIPVGNTPPEHYGISAREMEVLQHMAAGMSNQQIADTLFVSLSTVKTHASNLFVKLDVKRRTQAVDLARKLGWID